MTARIACIVEGHGESESVPILIRRIALMLGSQVNVEIPHPIRIAKSKLLKAGELERAVALAALTVKSRGAILVLVDSDDDCPAQLAPALLARARAARNDLPIAVVLPNREFESWFLAAAHSLGGRKGLPPDLEAPPNPEEVRGAKEWLNRRFVYGGYAPGVDQASFTGAFDLELARRAPSFDKCYREVVKLLQLAQNDAGE